MNKTVVVIIGSLAVLGVGGYLYFNSKSKKTTDEIEEDNTKSLISVPPKGEVLSTPEEVLDTAKKMEDARGLAKKVYGIKNNRDALKSVTSVSKITQVFTSLKYNVPKKPIGTGLFNYDTSLIRLRDVQIKKLNQEISDIEKILKDLGYQELKGDLVKIV